MPWRGKENVLETVTENMAELVLGQYVGPSILMVGRTPLRAHCVGGGEVRSGTGVSSGEGTGVPHLQ